MATEQKKSIQDQVDYFLAPPNSSATIRINGCEGTCTLPDYINVQFYSCNFESLKTNSNNLYFYKCDFKKDFTNFNLRNSACIFEECTFSSKVTFNSSKVEFIKCKIKQSIFVQNKSLLKSKDSDWTSVSGSFNKIGLFVLKSRVESIKDTWGKWEEFTVKGQNNSFISIVNPIKIQNYATFVYLSKNSTAEVWDFTKIEGEKADTSLFDINSASKLETFNVQNFKSVGTLIKAKDSVIKINKALTLQANKTLVDATSSDIYINGETYKNTVTGGTLFTADKSKVSLTSIKEIESQEGTFKLVSSNLDMIGASAQAKIKTKAKETFNAESSSIFAKVFDNITNDTDSVISATKNSKLYFYSIKDMKTSSSSKEAILLDQSICTLLNITNITSKDKTTVKTNNGARLQVLYVSNIKMENSGTTDDAAIYVGNNSFALITNSREIEGAHAFKVGSFSKLTVKNLVSAKATNSQGNGIDIDTNAVVNLVNCTTLEGKEYAIRCNKVGNKIKVKTSQNILSQKGIYLNESDLIIDNNGAGTNAKITGEKIELYSTKSTGSFLFSCTGPITLNTKLLGRNYDIELKGITSVNEIDITRCVLNGKFITSEVFTSKGSTSFLTDSDVGTTELKDLSITDLSYCGLQSLTANKSLVKGSVVKVNGELQVQNYAIADFDYISVTGNTTLGSATAKLAYIKSPYVYMRGDSFLFGLYMSNTRVVTKSHGSSLGNASSAFVDTYGSMFISADDMIEMKSKRLREVYTQYATMDVGDYWDITVENHIHMTSTSSSINLSAMADEISLRANTISEGATTTSEYFAGTEITTTVGASVITVAIAGITVTTPFEIL